MRIDYLSKLQEFIATLNHVADEQVKIYQDTIGASLADWQLIHHLIIDKIQQGRLSGQELARYIDQNEYSDVTMIQYHDQSYQLKFSINQSIPVQVIPQFCQEMKLLEKQDLFFVYDYHGDKSLYFSDRIELPQKDGFSILVVKFNLEKLLNRYFFFSEWKNTYASLIYNNEIIATTSPHLMGKSVALDPDSYLPKDAFAIKELDNDGGTYHYSSGDKQYYAIFKDIPDTELELFIDSNTDELESDWKYFVYRLVAFMGVILLIGFVVAAIFIKKFKRPIQKLQNIMKAVGEGDFSQHYQGVSFGFEINDIGYHFNQTIESLKKVLEDIKNVSVAKEVLEKELNLGQEVQQSILPATFIDPSLLVIDARCIPARQVGGDFYDIQQTTIANHLKIAIIIADTSGKGVFACLYSLGLRTLLRACLEAYDTIEEGILKANRLFCLDTAATSAFVTAFLGFYDPHTHELSYTCCGHLPAILLREGEVTELTTQGMALGVMDNMAVEVKTIQLEKDDRVFLYSDGITDATDSTGKLFEKESLLDILKKMTFEDPRTINQMVLTSVQEFSNGVEPFDDITLVTFKRPEG